MRKGKFVLALILVLAAGAAFYYFTTRGDRAAEVMDTRGMVEEAPDLLGAPSDSAAVVDTTGGVID